MEPQVLLSINLYRKDECGMDARDITEQYGFSIIFRRWVALWLDGVLMLLILVLAELTLGNEWYNKTLAVWLFVLALYFFVLEAKFGQTPGKWLLRIKVITLDGNPPGIVKSLIRNTVKILEANPLLFGGLLAGIISWMSSYKQRLGDKLARTYVVKVRDLQVQPKLAGVSLMKDMIQEIRTE
jgi:uncharacterized RDD family membrane protein YckC